MIIPRLLSSIIILMISVECLTAQCLLDSIVINAILIDPSGGDNEFDTNEDGIINSNDEFIEICNSSLDSIDVSGWVIGDDDPPPFPDFSFPDSTIIAPGQCLVVVVNYCASFDDNNETCNIPDGVIDMGLETSGLLGNSGDVITLVDTLGNSCTLVYGNVDCADVDPLDVPNFDPAACNDWGADVDGCPLLALGDSCDYLPVVLPIDLISFTAYVNDKQAIILEWVATNEYNNHYYEIQWSDSDNDFRPIGELLAKEDVTAMNNYDFTHFTPSDGINFYRLKQWDFNGEFSYSPVLALPIRFEEKIALYPSLVENSIRLTGDAPFYYLSIHSIDGYTIQDKILYQNNEFLNLDYLSDGHYICRVFNGKSITNLRFVKL